MNLYEHLVAEKQFAYYLWRRVAAQRDGRHMDALQRLEQFYDAFDQEAALTQFLGREVRYCQCQSMSERDMPRGSQAVALALSLWRVWFDDVTIADREIVRLDSDWAKSVAGATELFSARYLLGGRYVKRIPNLRLSKTMKPLTLGRDVVLDLGDFIWMDNQQIIKITNLFRVQ